MPMLSDVSIPKVPFATMKSRAHPQQASGSSRLDLDEEALTTLRGPVDSFVIETDFVNSLAEHAEKAKQKKKTVKIFEPQPVKRVASQLFQLPLGKQQLSSKNFSTGRVKRSTIAAQMTRGGPSLKKNAQISANVVNGIAGINGKARASGDSFAKQGATPITFEKASSQDPDLESLTPELEELRMFHSGIAKPTEYSVDATAEERDQRLKPNAQTSTLVHKKYIRAPGSSLEIDGSVIDNGNAGDYFAASEFTPIRLPQQRLSQQRNKLRLPNSQGRFGRKDNSATVDDAKAARNSSSDVKDMVRELRAELRSERQRLSHLLKRSQAQATVERNKLTSDHMLSDEDKAFIDKLYVMMAEQTTQVGGLKVISSAES